MNIDDKMAENERRDATMVSYTFLLGVVLVLVFMTIKVIKYADSLVWLEDQPVVSAISSPEANILASRVFPEEPKILKIKLWRHQLPPGPARNLIPVSIASAAEKGGVVELTFNRVDRKTNYFALAESKEEIGMFDPDEISVFESKSWRDTSNQRVLIALDKLSDKQPVSVMADGELIYKVN